LAHCAGPKDTLTTIGPVVEVASIVELDAWPAIYATAAGCAGRGSGDAFFAWARWEALSHALPLRGAARLLACGALVEARSVAWGRGAAQCATCVRYVACQTVGIAACQPNNEAPLKPRVDQGTPKLLANFVKSLKKLVPTVRIELTTY
jgi:hypothetical protein